MTHALLRIAGLGLLYGTVGTIATLMAYGALQAAGLVPRPPRSLDGMVAFFDRLVLTAIVLAIAGVAAGNLMWWGRSLTVSILGSMIAAGLLAVLLRPPLTVLAGHVATAAAGALVAGALACPFKRLRPTPADRRVRT